MSTEGYAENWELLTVEGVAGWLKVPKSWVYERTRRRGRHRLPPIFLAVGSSSPPVQPVSVM